MVTVGGKRLYATELLDFFQNENDRTMMSGYRKVAVVEEFSQILQQVHNKDCLHAGFKKTYARVCTCTAMMQTLYFQCLNSSSFFH